MTQSHPALQFIKTLQLVLMSMWTLSNFCNRSFLYTALGMSGSEFLDGKEADLALLVAKVEASNLRQCELLQSCSPPFNCSRFACWPLEGDIQKSTCQPVISNIYCNDSSSSTCSLYKKFDYSKSFVRISPTTDVKAAITVVGVCSQRELDTIFKNVTNPESLFRAFFGSVDGTYQHFPGTDLSVEDCLLYDPRLRPWYTYSRPKSLPSQVHVFQNDKLLKNKVIKYRISTSVAKVVMVLVDAGASMGNVLPTPSVGTYLSAAQAIALQLLNTLSEQDSVNIIMFNSSSSTTLASSPVRVLYHQTGDSTYHPEFDHLKASLQNISVENIQKPSNLTFGIDAALSSFVSNFTTSLKVIMVLTDGNANTLTEGSLASLNAQAKLQVKVFIFKIPQPDDPDVFLRINSNNFLSKLCSVGGSFNVISAVELSNPLLSVRPYFSFLAAVRASLSLNHTQADYSAIYQDYENVVNDIFSISRPAFDTVGNLLGIVGLNIFMDGLGNLTNQVTAALANKTMLKAFDPTTFVLNATNYCSIQNSTAEQLCPLTTLPSNGGFCPQTDNTSKIQDLACCANKCESSAVRSTLKRILIVTGSTLVLVITVVIICTLIYCKAKQREINRTILRSISAFPGEDSNDERSKHSLDDKGTHKEVHSSGS